MEPHTIQILEKLRAALGLSDRALPTATADPLQLAADQRESREGQRRVDDSD